MIIDAIVQVFLYVFLEVFHIRVDMEGGLQYNRGVLCRSCVRASNHSPVLVMIRSIFYLSHISGLKSSLEKCKDNSGCLSISKTPFLLTRHLEHQP